MMEEKATLVVKRKNIQTLFDYALDNRISFIVNPKGLSPDEFEVDLSILGIKQAIALGMFAKEHKFEVLGLSEMSKSKPVANVSKKPEAKENPSAESGLEKTEQQPIAAVLNF